VEGKTLVFSLLLGRFYSSGGLEIDTLLRLSHMADANSKPSEDGLTQEQFRRLLARLHSERDPAALKYEELRFKLVKFFQWSFCSSAEDLADETLTRVAHKLHDSREEIQDVEALLWGIAKRLRQEARKRDFRTINLSQVPDARLSDIGASLDSIHRKIQMEKEQECLRKCLRRLPDEDRELFLAYRIDKGHYLERRKELAEKFGLTPGALRVRVIRLREKLVKCIARCLGERSSSSM
jgi:RNA polymerase sigma factor (sigma-70 family)